MAREVTKHGWRVRVVPMRVRSKYRTLTPREGRSSRLFRHCVFFKGECDLGHVHATHAPLAKKKKQGGRCATHEVQRSSALHGAVHDAASDACIRPDVVGGGRGNGERHGPMKDCVGLQGTLSNRRSGGSNPKAVYRDTYGRGSRS